MSADKGARNLILMFLGVAGCVTIFYGYLAWHALALDSMFIQFIETKRSQPIVHASNERADKSPLSMHANVGRGRRLYLVSGCALCHGGDGAGQVQSPNYVKDTMPALNVLAERMFLIEPEDVETVVEALEPGAPLDAAGLDVPRAGAVVAQYESIRQVIVSGNPGGKKVSTGNDPFDMPKWNDRLTQPDVNDVIAYLLSLYPWPQAEQQ